MFVNLHIKIKTMSSQNSKLITSDGLKSIISKNWKPITQQNLTYPDFINRVTIVFANEKRTCAILTNPDFSSRIKQLLSLVKKGGNNVIIKTRGTLDRLFCHAIGVCYNYSTHTVSKCIQKEICCHDYVYENTKDYGFTYCSCENIPEKLKVGKKLKLVRVQSSEEDPSEPSLQNHVYKSKRLIKTGVEFNKLHTNDRKFTV